MEMNLTEEQFEILQPIIVTSRVMGIFPVSFLKFGTRYELKYSRALLCFSYFLIMALTAFLVRGMLVDLTIGEPNIRLKKPKVVYLAFCDINSVVCVALYAMISNPCRVKNFWKLLKIWARIDSQLPIVDSKAYRRKSVTAIVTVVLVSMALFLFDALMSISASDTDIFVFFSRYGCFYILYYNLVFVGIFVWHLALFINIRLDSLHKQLIDERRYLSSKLTFVTSRKHLNSARRMIVWLSMYRKIKDSVDVFNDSPSFGVLSLTLSCLIHLTVTPYFLLIELAQRGDWLFISVQLVWLAAHTSTLLLLIEPCHRCLNVTQLINSSVSSLLMLDIDEETRKAVEKFMTYMAHCSINFKASGLFTINRNLITSVAGVVSTYLVIILQFNNVS